MKKILIIAVPIALLAILLTAGAVQSFGRHSHGHGMMKDFLFYKLDKVGEELKLNPSQQAKMDTFKRDLEAVFDERSDKRKEVHETITAEMQKENPDVNKISALVHQQIDERAQLAHDLTNRVSELYQDLSPEQRKLLSEMLDRMHGKEWE